MSILIKDMEMPKSCMDCPFKGFDRAGGRGNICTINDSITLHAVLDGVDVKFVRMGDCPLVPVPPHGDLIDKKTVTDNLCKILTNAKPPTNYPNWNDAIIAVMTTPTIIPAEEGET